MCGIGGIVGEPVIANPAAWGRLFSNSLAHRGPDGKGFVGIGKSGSTIRLTDEEQLASLAPLTGVLAHRRLSIIDLATGDQPIVLDDGRLAIIYNGEIYNYRELRDELAHRGARFLTRSDTEVILRAYQQWGTAGFARLNGIFAFALYDSHEERVLLVRDPVGVKPLYWAQQGRSVAFASEIRPLREAGLVPGVVDPVSLAQYLFYRFVPAPRTLWTGLHKVMPGHALVFDRAGQLIEDVDYARPAPDSHARPTGDLVDEMVARFQQAIRRQMISDVPIGAFLSGGLDSSLVVAAMREEGNPPLTFAVGFPGGASQSSELDAARHAATLLATDHHERAVDLTDYMTRLGSAIRQVEEPLAHPGMLLQGDLAALAREKVKVVLTGQGADEPLGGYPRHQAARLAASLGGSAGPIGRTLLGMGGTRRENWDRLLQAISARSGLARAAALFSPSGAGNLVRVVRGLGAGDATAAVHGALEPWWRRAEGLDETARVLYVDVRTSLADDLLLVGDKMSMAHGLEARVPYLDLDYLDFVESIPGADRVHLVGPRKWLQQRLGARVLPPELMTSLRGSSGQFRKKRGFDVPVGDWLRGKLGASLTGFMAGSDSLLPTLVDQQWIRQVSERYLRGSGEAYRTVLSLYALELWLRESVGPAGHGGLAYDAGRVA